MFYSNYHTHTKRCGHATKEDEDYVVAALGDKITVLGFSDHIMLPQVSQKEVRGESYLLDDYINSINFLKKKYQGQIEIHLGFEAESFPLFFSYYKDLLTTKGIEYLILGNHYDMDENKKITKHFLDIESASDLYRYRDLAIEAMKTNMFTIFAHPDYFMYSLDEYNLDARKVSYDLVQAALKYNVLLEINTGGIRVGKKRFKKSYRYGYPTSQFFKIASKLQAPCIFGIDAHSPSAILDESSQYEALKFAKDLNLYVVDRCKFKEIQ